MFYKKKAPKGNRKGTCTASFQDAFASLEQVQHFLEFRGMMHEATILSRTVDDLARVSANSSLQTTLHDYFLFVNTAYS